MRNPPQFLGSPFLVREGGQGVRFRSFLAPSARLFSFPPIPRPLFYGRGRPGAAGARREGCRTPVLRHLKQKPPRTPRCQTPPPPKFRPPPPHPPPQPTPPPS